MPGYQNPSAKKSTQDSNLKLQHIATLSDRYLSPSTGNTIAASWKWNLEETQNSSEDCWVDAPCTKKIQKHSCGRGAFWIVS